MPPVSSTFSQTLVQYGLFSFECTKCQKRDLVERLFRPWFRTTSFHSLGNTTNQSGPVDITNVKVANGTVGDPARVTTDDIMWIPQNPVPNAHSRPNPTVSDREAESSACQDAPLRSRFQRGSSISKLHRGAAAPPLLLENCLQITVQAEFSHDDGKDIRIRMKTECDEVLCYSRSFPDSTSANRNDCLWNSKLKDFPWQMLRDTSFHAIAFIAWKQSQEDPHRMSRSWRNRSRLGINGISRKTRRTAPAELEFEFLSTVDKTNDWSITIWSKSEAICFWVHFRFEMCFLLLKTDSDKDIHSGEREQWRYSNDGTRKVRQE
jgi:hypothetical protein